MAIPGHPYFTKRLDRLRRRQRLALSAIPDRVLRNLKIGERPAVPKERTGRVEFALRQLAAPLVVAEDEFLARSARIEDWQAFRRWASDVDFAIWTDHVRAELEQLGDFDEERELHELIRGDDDLSARLERIAVLLVWADDAAGDYVDPRVEKLRG